MLLKAHNFVFSDNRNKLGHQYLFSQNASQVLIEKVKEKFHLKIELPDSTGKGGTSINGNAVQLLLGSTTDRALSAE